MLSSYSVEKMFDMSLSICCVILVLLHCMWLNLRGHHSLDLSSASSSFTPPTCEPRPHHSFLCLYFDPLVLQLCVSPCFNIYQTSSLHKSKPAQSHLSTFSLNSLIQVCDALSPNNPSFHLPPAPPPLFSSATLSPTYMQRGLNVTEQ